jgi:HTH-type transcriptional regulator/antitoxin HigA
MKHETHSPINVSQLSGFFEQVNSIASNCSSDLSTLFYYMEQPVNSETELLERAKVMDDLMDLARSEEDIIMIFANAIANRIEEYEKNNLEFPELKPSEVLAYMMNIKNIKQKDLAHIATQSIISEILHNKRSMTVEHIKGFSRFFNIPTTLFMN